MRDRTVERWVLAAIVVVAVEACAAECADGTCEGMGEALSAPPNPPPASNLVPESNPSNLPDARGQGDQPGQPGQITPGVTMEGQSPNNSAAEGTPMSMRNDATPADENAEITAPEPTMMPAVASDGLRDVLLVGNGVAGTVSFVDAVTFENLGSVDVIPDLEETLADINRDLVRSVAYPLVKNGQLLHHFEPSGGDRYVDDIFVSPDGEVLYVSRSNLGDVAAFDLSQPGHPQLWRNNVEGIKADHATISPDGTLLIVSATTANVADVLDARTGEIVNSFPTGDFPHQNDYSHDGKSVYNSSIGNVGYNSVSYANNGAKGRRTLVKVDAETFTVQKTWVFEYGVRPNVISPDETILYTQLSYLNGVIKYDLVESQEIARSDQPLSEFAMNTYATYDEYPHDSAHHGLALSADGRRLCDCGTIDNNVAIVRTDDMSVEHMIDVGLVPYWATNDPSGQYCFVSLSGDDAVSVIEYATGTLVTTVPVGHFPQRSRLGRVPQEVIDGLNAIGG